MRLSWSSLKKCAFSATLYGTAPARDGVLAPWCLLSDGITPSERKGRGKRRDRVEGGWNVCAERGGRGAIRFQMLKGRPIRWEIGGCNVTFLLPGLTSTIGWNRKLALGKFARCILAGLENIAKRNIRGENFLGRIEVFARCATRR